MKPKTLVTTLLTAVCATLAQPAPSQTNNSIIRDLPASTNLSFKRIVYDANSVSLLVTNTIPNVFYHLEESSSLTAWETNRTFKAANNQTNIVVNHTNNVREYRVAQDGFLIYSSTPVVSSGPNYCIGTMAGYANYIPTNNAPGTNWGWIPDTNTTQTATDIQRTNSGVAFLGKYGHTGCDTGSIAIEPLNPSYRFTIYFPSNVPTGPYPIYLRGFKPL